MSDLKYTEQHEWIRVEGDIGTIGISDYAQEQLGDVVYVDLPESGKAVEKDGEIAVVESVKAANEIYAPVTGEVTAANAALSDNPSLVNSAPTGDGWIAKIKMSDLSQLDGLMDAQAYKEFVDDLD